MSRLRNRVDVIVDEQPLGAVHLHCLHIDVVRVAIDFRDRQKTRKAIGAASPLVCSIVKTANSGRFVGRSVKVFSSVRAPVDALRSRLSVMKAIRDRAEDR